jgi:hypothetical protein
MESYPWDEHRFLTISVERPKESLLLALKAHGYVHLCDHGDWGGPRVARELQEILNRFGGNNP